MLLLPPTAFCYGYTPHTAAGSPVPHCTRTLPPLRGWLPAVGFWLPRTHYLPAAGLRTLVTAATPAAVATCVGYAVVLTCGLPVHTHAVGLLHRGSYLRYRYGSGYTTTAATARFTYALVPAVTPLPPLHRLRSRFTRYPTRVCSSRAFCVLRAVPTVPGSCRITAAGLLPGCGSVYTGLPAFCTFGSAVTLRLRLWFVPFVTHVLVYTAALYLRLRLPLRLVTLRIRLYIHPHYHTVPHFPPRLVTFTVYRTRGAFWLHGYYPARTAWPVAACLPALPALFVPQPPRLYLRALPVMPLYIPGDMVTHDATLNDIR